VVLRPFTAMTAVGLVAGLAACAETGDTATQSTFRPTYLGIKAAPLDPTLFRFDVAMKGARDRGDVDSYARCAAAGYAASKGFGFVRQLSTNVQVQGGIWRANAVYTISPGLPGGIRTIDAEVTVADCAEQGIPTV
jgi:hypothetical protein